MNSKIKTILLVVAIVLLIGGAAFAYNALEDGAQLQNNMPASEDKGDAEKVKAPDFTVTDKDGNPIKLSELLGKPIVLNFWASWCPPCKAEMPEFEETFQEFGDDVHFVMINTLDRDTVENGINFIDEAGYSFPIYFDTNDSEATMSYGIRSYPTTVFVDKDGWVVTGIEGKIDENTLRSGISLAKE